MGFHAPKVLPHTCIYGQTPPTLLRRRSAYCRVYAFFESGSFSEQMTIAKRYVNSNVLYSVARIHCEDSASKRNNANLFAIIFAISIAYNIQVKKEPFGSFLTHIENPIKDF